MKNILNIVLLIIAFITLFVIGLLIVQNSAENQKQYENNSYNLYVSKIIKGGDVTTLINKATNENEKNQVPKNENGYYIENNTNSIKVDILIEDQKYDMEDIYENGTLKFIQIFNLASFKCTNIEYHKETNKIKRITIEEI